MDITQNLTALMVIMTIALIVFHITKATCLQFMSLEDWTRRRNLWLTLTALAFLSPSFWAYALIATPLMVRLGMKDSNPVSAYVLLMYVIPPYQVEIPSVLVESLFSLDNRRILSLSILAPLAWRFLTRKDKNRFQLTDIFVLSYAVLNILLLIPYESITNTARRSFLFALDWLLIYYTFSRSCCNLKKVTEVMATFTLACAVMAPIAVVETLKSWILYAELADTWDIVNRGAYLFRAGTLRAQASTGHSLELGCVMAIGFGYWLHLGSTFASKTKLRFGIALMWVGLIAAYSRGAWIFALLTYYILAGLSKNGFNKIIKALFISSTLLAILIISPIGERVIDSLPFIGTIDNENVTYRQEIAERTWELVQRNPIFGDPFYAKNMEDMRQGEGIIDIVNAYAVVALGTGLLGLFLFITPAIVSLYVTYRNSKSLMILRPEYSKAGYCLVASTLGYLFYIGTAGMNPTAYIYIGMLVGFSKIPEYSRIEGAGQLC